MAPALEHLRLADMVGVVRDLALQVVERHPVVVDDADGADARRRQVEHERRAEAAGADDEHAGAFQLLLSLAADFLQHEVALVALDLRRRQAGRGGFLHPPSLAQLERAVSGSRRRPHMLVNGVTIGTTRKGPGWTRPRALSSPCGSATA